mmetsp:Transcript_4242/g.13288  ORF Transcript_4242/g.13288 Transcript_4242/m.13288 type:complete len:259 (-) Transcript_4242:595-1371(-)
MGRGAGGPRGAGNFDSDRVPRGARAARLCRMPSLRSRDAPRRRHLPRRLRAVPRQRLRRHRLARGAAAAAPGRFGGGRFRGGVDECRSFFGCDLCADRALFTIKTSNVVRRRGGARRRARRRLRGVRMRLKDSSPPFNPRALVARRPRGHGRQRGGAVADSGAAADKQTCLCLAQELRPRVHTEQARAAAACVARRGMVPRRACICAVGGGDPPNRKELAPTVSKGPPKRNPVGPYRGRGGARCDAGSRAGRAVGPVF